MDRQRTARVWGWTAGLMALAISAGLSAGQSAPMAPGKTGQPAGKAAPKATTPPPTPPAAVPGPAAAPKADDIIEPGPFVEVVRIQNRTLDINVHLDSTRLDEANQRVKRNIDPTTPVVEWQSLSFVFPLLTQTAGSVSDPKKATATVKVEGREMETKLSVLERYPAGVQLLKAEIGAGSGRGWDFTVKIAAATGGVKFDERRAMEVGWPKGGWPAAAQSTFTPQMFLDLGPDGKPQDLTKLKAMVAEWTGNDPKGVGPVKLAKYLAQQVVQNFQIMREPVIYYQGIEVLGVDLQPVEQSVETMRGTEFDLVNLLTAVYRAAGLPARVVIGWDTRRTQSSATRPGTAEELRAWVEFCLFDEHGAAAEQTGARFPRTGPDGRRQDDRDVAGKHLVNWVPVDVVQLAKRGGRNQRLEQPWRFFGTMEDLDAVIPFAFQWHPPTTVRAYVRPAFWGWTVWPKTPDDGSQRLRFSHGLESKRGGGRE